MESSFELDGVVRNETTTILAGWRNMLKDSPREWEKRSGSSPKRNTL
jgi:hypothetical protein